MDDIKKLRQELKFIKKKNNSLKNQTKTLLITGATGTLGSELLKYEGKKFNKVYAISRKIKRSIGNIIWIKGDLSKTNLGLNKQKYIELSKKIDTVIHCAAEVNNIKTRKQLFKNNVLSTINIIKFCSEYNYKKLHYASTLSVIISKHEQNSSLINNNKLQITNDHLLTGYAESKWQAEFLIQMYIKKASIYRYGLLIPKNEILEKNHFLNVVLKFAYKYKEFPLDYQNYSFDYSILNKNILSLKSESGIYNKSNNHFITLKELIDQHHININWIDINEWKIKYNKKIITQMFNKTKYYFFETTDIDKFL